MSIRGEAAIKAFFTTGSRPTQQQFYDWIESCALHGDTKGLVPLAKFGLSMQNYTDADVDQLAAFQAAIDSAASVGDIILLPGGKLVLDGTLKIPTIGGMIGASMYHSHIKLADGANARLIEVNNPNIGSSGSGTGGLANIIRNFTINGNAANNTFTGSLVLFTSGNSNLTNQTQMRDIWGHPRNFVDPRRIVSDLYIVDAPDIGLETSGRGESRMDNIFIRNTGGNGMKIGSFDEWFSRITTEAPGGAGFEFASGASQVRMETCKAYFTGNNAARTDGDGFVCTAGGVGNLQLVACTAQDTHRHGFNLTGDSIILSACQTESIGTAYPVFGVGNATVDLQISAVRALGLKNSRIQIMHSDRQVAQSVVAPYCNNLVDIRSTSTLNEFEFFAGTQGVGGNEYEREFRTNNLTIGGRNWVSVNGRKVYGVSFTATQIENALEGINAKGKHQGMMVYDTTNNRPLWATGDVATDPWVDSAGATIITPA